QVRLVLGYGHGYVVVVNATDESSVVVFKDIALVWRAALLAERVADADALKLLNDSAELFADRRVDERVDFFLLLRGRSVVAVFRLGCFRFHLSLPWAGWPPCR